MICIELAKHITTTQRPVLSADSLQSSTMKRPSQRRDLLALLSILLLDNFLLYAHASTDFDCRLSVNDVNFDLTTLAGEQIVNRTRSTPPTTMIDSLRFDLCADLKTIDGLAEHDQVRLRASREPDVCWIVQCTDDYISSARPVHAHV
jgi:hypothetical protein